MSKMQESLDKLKANLAEERQVIVQLLDRIVERVTPDPEAANDAEEVAAMSADVRGMIDEAKAVLDKPVFQPSGN